MEESTRIRVLIVDDHAVVRMGLRVFFDLQDDMEVVGEAADGSEGVAMARRLAPDVVLLDPRIPAMNGGRAIIGCLRDAAPGVRVLVLNWSDAAGGGQPAGDADAYIKKTFRPHELIDAVVAAARTPIA